MRTRTENSLSVSCAPMCFSGTSPEGGGCQSLICTLHFVSERARGVYARMCVLSLSHVEHTWTDHLICSLFSARAMHAQQKSSPVSHSIELENITLGLHSVRQIQPRLMLIHHIPERASFCALDASRACFFLFRSSHAPLAL
jgi:hypothetical protein